MMLVFLLLMSHVLGARAELVAKRYFVLFEEQASTSFQPTSQNNYVLRQASTAGLNFTGERFIFREALSAVSIEFSATPDDSQITYLQQIPGVRAVYPVKTIPRPVIIESPMRQDISSSSLIDADKVHKTLDLTGKGIKVGVIDTGIDYTHPDLGGCLGPDCKVIGGADIVGDDFSSNTGYRPVPDADPQDCVGHGTHVAGIIAAKGNMTGVAPDAKLLAYKVFGCSGGTTDEAVLLAVEAAMKDGVQVINLSLGSDGEGWPTEVVATALSNVVAKGIVVVAAAGNVGVKGTFHVASPSSGTDIVSVASFDGTGVVVPGLTVTSPLPATTIAHNNAQPKSDFTPGTYTLGLSGGSVEGYDGCYEIPSGTLTGKVAVIQRGGCVFAIKVRNAQAAGAVGALVYNNVPGLFTPSNTVDQWVLPIIAIDDASGKMIVNWLGNGTVVKISIEKGKTVSYSIPGGGSVSQFSSKGPSLTLDVKPDVGAPGGNIRSTWPSSLDSSSPGYQILSGTSMAAPHIAGCVALMLQGLPWLASKPTQIRDVLLNTAYPRDSKTSGVKSGVHVQGAGLANALSAIQNSKLSISPAKIALLDRNHAKTFTLTISSQLNSSITLDVSSVLGTTEQRQNGGLADKYATVSLSTANVTVEALGSTSVEVTVKPPFKLPAGTVYSGFVQFISTTGGLRYSVPFLGVSGNYHDVPVVDGEVQLLNCRKSDVFFCDKLADKTAANGKTSALAFSQSKDRPAIYIPFEFAAKRVTIQLIQAQNETVVHKYNSNQLPVPAEVPTYVRFPIKIKQIKQITGKYFARATVFKPLSTRSKNSSVVYTSSQFAVVL